MDVGKSVNLSVRDSISNTTHNGVWDLLYNSVNGSIKSLVFEAVRETVSTSLNMLQWT